MAEATPPIEVLLVTSPGCHFCEHAERVLAELGEKVPIRVTTLDLMSDEGRDLAASHRIPFPPLLLVDGAFFGFGRVSRRKLERYLEARPATAVEA